MTNEQAEIVIEAWRDIARPPTGPNMSRAELRPTPGAIRDLLQALATTTRDPGWCGELITMHEAVPNEPRPIARARIRELLHRLDSEQEDAA